MAAGLVVEKTTGTGRIVPLVKVGVPRFEMGGAMSRAVFHTETSIKTEAGPQRTVPRSSVPAPPGWLQLATRIQRADDPLEREADYVADRVLKMPSWPSNLHTAPFVTGAAPRVQRKCARCEAEERLQRKCAACEEEERRLQRKQTDEAGAHVAPPIVRRVLGSQGEPLDASTRAYFEPRFGQGFEHVRVHSDGQAAESARAVNARAYTVGRHVVFGAGSYDPASRSGQRLLAHELTHVVQQGAATFRRPEGSPPENEVTPPKPRAQKAGVMMRDIDDEMFERVQRRRQHFAELDPDYSNILPPEVIQISPILDACYDVFLENVRALLARRMVSARARDRAFSRQLLNTTSLIILYCQLRSTVESGRPVPVSITIIRQRGSRWIRAILAEPGWINLSAGRSEHIVVPRNVIREAEDANRRQEERSRLYAMFRAFVNDRNLRSGGQWELARLATAIKIYANAIICLAGGGRPARNLEMGSEEAPDWLENARRDWESLLPGHGSGSEGAASESPQGFRGEEPPSEVPTQDSGSADCEQPNVDRFCQNLARVSRSARTSTHQPPPAPAGPHQANVGYGRELIPLYRQWARSLVAEMHLTPRFYSGVIEEINQDVTGACVSPYRR